MINWKNTLAAVWRPKSATLRPVSTLDPILLDDLLGVDDQKNKLVANTKLFLSGGFANNALLWGSRGTGKSSLVKALLNQYASEGLRVIEIDRDDLSDLPEIVDEIRELPYWFIVFSDDLSFDDEDKNFKHLKSVLEGSIEPPPKNVIVYATSNRRHLLSESIADNTQTKIVNQELHHGDIVEEKLSLADRFGLWLSFYPFSWNEYFALIDHHFQNKKVDRKALHESARLFALGRANHSGRTAKQFVAHWDAQQSEN